MIWMKIPDMLKKKKPKDMKDTEDLEQNFQEELQEASQAQQKHKNDLEEPEEISETEKLRAEVNEARDKYVRLYAEFDNFKRRTTKERIDLLQSAGKDVIAELIPVIDDFERASKSMETATDIQAVKEGVGLVHNKLKNILQQKGLKEMQSKGEVFNADLHEAITSTPAPSADLKGKVVDELEKGYYLNDKVIRFAKVVVGS
jgi:molecular chaperone GrpE